MLTRWEQINDILIWFMYIPSVSVSCKGVRTFCCFPHPSVFCRGIFDWVSHLSNVSDACVRHWSTIVHRCWPAVPPNVLLIGCWPRLSRSACAIKKCVRYREVCALSRSACAIEKRVRYWEVRALLRSACTIEKRVRYWDMRALWLESWREIVGNSMSSTNWGVLLYRKSSTNQKSRPFWSSSTMSRFWSEIFVAKLTVDDQKWIFYPKKWLFLLTKIQQILDFRAIFAYVTRVGFCLERASKKVA